MHYTLTTVKPGTARRLGIRRPCPTPARLALDPVADFEAAVKRMLASWLVPHVDQSTGNRHTCHGECSTT